MNRLKLSYGFKGPEREELLRKTMCTNHDKVYYYSQTTDELNSFFIGY
jgi:hypothetical protein